MSAPVRSGRRADRFASLVEAHRLDRRGPRPVAPSAPPSETERALLELVAGLRNQALYAPTPRADFTADLRSQLMVQADLLLKPQGPHPSVRPVGRATTFHRPVRGVAAAAAAVVLVGTAGLAVAARDTTSGDPLYQVKRGMESLSTSFSVSEASRGRGYLSHAQSRLQEVSQLLRSDADQAQVHETLARFSASAAEGSTLMFQSYARTSNDQDVFAVRDFAQGAMDDLVAFAAMAPSSLRSELSAAAVTVQDVDEQARVLCAACGAGEDLSVPGVLQPPSSEDRPGSPLGNLTGQGQGAGSLSGGKTVVTTPLTTYTLTTTVDTTVTLDPLTPIIGLPPVLNPGSGESPSGASGSTTGENPTGTGSGGGTTVTPLTPVTISDPVEEILDALDPTGSSDDGETVTREQPTDDGQPTSTAPDHGTDSAPDSPDATPGTGDEPETPASPATDTVTTVTAVARGVLAGAGSAATTVRPNAATVGAAAEAVDTTAAEQPAAQTPAADAGDAQATPARPDDRPARDEAPARPERTDADPVVANQARPGAAAARADEGPVRVTVAAAKAAGAQAAADAPANVD